MRIDSNCYFGLTGFIQIISSDWFWMGHGLIRIEKLVRIRSEWKFLVRIQIPKWFRKYRTSLSEPIRNFPNHSGICIRIKQFHSDLIRRNFSIRINPRRIQNQSERFQSIRINPHLQSELTRSIRLKPNISD